MEERNYYALVNEIMSNQNAPTIILAPFDGEHVGFLVDLTSNYKKTVWYDHSYENIFPFVLMLLKKYLQDENAVENVRKLLTTSLGIDASLSLAKYLLDSVRKTNDNTLFILSGLDAMSEKDREWLFYILNNCPPNLKIVMVSEKIVDLNYAALAQNPPHLLSDEWTVAEKFTPIPSRQPPLSGSEIDLLYALSERRFVPADYAKHLYGDRLEKLPRYVSQRYRSAVFHAGDIYVFGADLNAQVRPFVTGGAASRDLVRNFTDFCLQKEEYIRAIHTCLNNDGLYEKGNEAARRGIDSDAFLIDASAYITRNGDLFLQNDFKDYPYLRILKIMRDVREDVFDEDSLAFLTERKGASERETVLLNALYAKALEKMGKKAEWKTHTERAFYAGYRRMGRDYFRICTPLLRAFLLTGRNSDEFDKPTLIEEIEKYFSEKTDGRRPLLAARKAFMEHYVVMGNYAAASRHLSALISAVPHYVVPMSVISSALLAGDVEASRKWAKDVVEMAVGSAEKPSGYVDALTILGLANLYLDKDEDALEMLNEALCAARHGSAPFMRALCVKTMLFAEMGQAENALQLARIYVKTANAEDVDVLYAAIAYCYCAMEMNDEAVQYATRALETLQKRAPIGMVASAIKMKADIEARKPNVALATEKFLAKIERNGLGMLIVLLQKCFRPIWEYAEGMGVDSPYVAFLKAKANEREQALRSVNGVKVNFFGTMSASFCGKQIKWKTTKARELFYLYVLVGQDGVSRADVLANYWSDYTYESAINNLKTTNSMIRKTLTEYGIPFSLDYSNAKYTLQINLAESDYALYKKLIGRVEKEKDMSKKSILMTHLLRKYNDGFATEIKNKYFNAKRVKLKEEAVTLTVRTIKELMTAGMQVEAKSFLTLLKRMTHTSEYNAVLAELEKLNV